MRLRTLVLLFAWCIQLSPAWGVTLATWDFLSDAQPMADGRAPNVLDPNLESVQGLTRGGSLTAVTTARLFSSEGWGDNANSFAAWATKEDAITDLDFITFSLQPTAGNVVSLDTLDYKIRRTSTGPTKFIWQYQVGIGAFADIGEVVEYTAIDASGLFQPQLNLTSIPALQDVDDPITFRLVAWANTGSGSFGIGRNPNTTTAQDIMILTGTAGPIGGGPLDGDINGDGKVDSADYVVWRNTDLPQSQYDLWKANFGKTSMDNGASVGSSVVVPEPCAAILLLAGFLGLATARRCRQ